MRIESNRDSGSTATAAATTTDERRFAGRGLPRPLSTSIRSDRTIPARAAGTPALDRRLRDTEAATIGERAAEVRTACSAGTAGATAAADESVFERSAGG